MKISVLPVLMYLHVHSAPVLEISTYFPHPSEFKDNETL